MKAAFLKARRAGIKRLIAARSIEDAAPGGPDMVAIKNEDDVDIFAMLESM